MQFGSGTGTSEAEVRLDCAREDPGFLGFFAGNEPPVSHAKYFIATHATVFAQFCEKYKDALDAGIIPDHQLAGLASGTTHVENIIQNNTKREFISGLLTKDILK
jgi:hypothetical protein